MELIVAGKTSKEIAVALDISTKTVETHRANLMRKLKLSKPTEVVLYAIRHGIYVDEEQALAEVDAELAKEMKNHAH